MASSDDAEQPPVTDRQRRTKHDPKHPLEYAIFGFVVATAIATAAAAVFTRNQWLTAQQQLGVMRDTEQRQLRAYPFVDHGSFRATDKTADLTVRVHHAGVTPAYKSESIRR